MESDRPCPRWGRRGDCGRGLVCRLSTYSGIQSMRAVGRTAEGLQFKLFWLRDRIEGRAVPAAGARHGRRAVACPLGTDRFRRAGYRLKTLPGAALFMNQSSGGRARPCKRRGGRLGPEHRRSPSAPFLGRTEPAADDAPQRWLTDCARCGRPCRGCWRTQSSSTSSARLSKAGQSERASRP